MLAIVGFIGCGCGDGGILAAGRRIAQTVAERMIVVLRLHLRLFLSFALMLLLRPLLKLMRLLMLMPAATFLPAIVCRRR